MNLLDRSLSPDGLVLFGLILGRYLLIAGGLYWLFYSLLAERLTRRRVQHWPTWKKSIRSDIGLSTASASVFALSASWLTSAPVLIHTRLYTDVSQYGFFYLIFSFFLILILQDTGFYFCHRFFHQPWLFRWVHRGHHRSQSPTPWTSFAFDLPEAVMQALLIIGIVFVVPVHIGTLLAALVTMTLWSVFNHLGFSLFPDSGVSQWLAQWLIGPQHHMIHHRRYSLHYGLYFTFWDRLLGTQIEASKPKTQRSGRLALLATSEPLAVRGEES